MRELFEAVLGAMVQDFAGPRAGIFMRQSIDFLMSDSVPFEPILKTKVRVLENVLA